MTCYLTYDHLGSVRMITDQNGNVVSRHDFLPYGEEIPAGVGGRSTQFGGVDGVSQRFTGQMRDAETGEDYFNARMFGSALGRFTSPDPGHAGADLMNPQSWNGYNYALGNPLLYTDPTGRWSFSDLWSGIGSFFGNVAAEVGNFFNPPCAKEVCFTPVSTGYLDPVGGGLPGGPSGGGGASSSVADSGVTTFTTTVVATAPVTLVSNPPPNNGLTPAQLQTILNAAKKDAAACAGTFSTGMGPFGLRFSLKGFDAQIQNTKYLQYPNPATSPLGPLSSVEAQALKGSIALYPNFFTDISPRQAGIVVHENLHVYTGWSDSNVFSVFQQRGITPNDLTQFMKYGNTDGITTWIVRGCR